MKVLSFQQPWATLVASGIKDVENRTWKPQVNPGRFLIHASKKLTGAVINQLPIEWAAPLVNQVEFGNVPFFNEWPSGAIIGYATLDRVEEKTKSVWDSGEEGYKWILKDAHLFDEPIEGVKGKLHFFDYDLDENNLPPAHQVNVRMPKREGDELVVPVSQANWEALSTMKGDGENDCFEFDIDNLVVDVLCEPGVYTLKPIQSIRFEYNGKMQRFEVEPTSVSIYDGDENGKLYGYFSLFSKEPVNRPKVIYVLGKRLEEGEKATAKEWPKD